MILSVSRRTDIPGCYPEWFMNRLRDKYVMTRNPMNFHQVKSLILLSPPYFLSEELTVTATVFLYSSFVFTINTTVSTFGIIISDLNILRTRINTCFLHHLLFCHV